MKSIIFLCLFSLTLTLPTLASSPSRPQATIAAIQNLQSTKILIAAHRGGYENDLQNKAPENTLANIQIAQQKGFDLYETDIQRSKDGHFIIVHDPTLNRETTGTGPASELTLAQLKALKKTYRNGQTSPHPIATFEEFLQQGRSRILFKLDMKPGIDKYFTQLVALVAKHNMLNAVIFRVPFSDLKKYTNYHKAGHPYTNTLLMFKVSSKKQIDQVKKALNPRTLEIAVDKNDPTHPDTLALIRYAVSQNFLVETHSHGSPTDWAKLTKAGVRMFHTQTPTILQTFLNQ